MGVSIGCFYLKDAFFDGKQGHIKSSATKVKNKNILLSRLFPVEAIRDGSRSWLIDYPKNVESGNDSSIFSCLSLRIIEISWYSDHSLVNFLAQISLCSLPHLIEDHAGDLLSLESLLFTLEFHLNHRLVICSSSRDHLE